MGWFGSRTVSGTNEPLLDEVILAIRQAGGWGDGDTAESIRPDALLGADLGLSSIAVARLASILQKRRGRDPLPFHTLFVKPDGTMVQDIRVRDVVEFLRRRSNETPP